MSTVTACQLRPDIGETPWDSKYHHLYCHDDHPLHGNKKKRGLLVSNAMTTGSRPKPSLLPTLLLFPSGPLLPCQGDDDDCSWYFSFLFLIIRHCSMRTSLLYED